MDERLKSVFDALSALCAKREYCVADIRRKALQRLSDGALSDAGAMVGAASAADEIVAALVSEGYVDDRRYAAAYAREKSALSGWGPVKIRSALLARGVPREVVLEALDEIDPARATAKLEKVLETKWRTLRDDPQGRLKLIRFALSRGYDYEPVKPLIEAITHSGSGSGEL